MASREPTAVAGIDGDGAASQCRADRRRVEGRRVGETAEDRWPDAIARGHVAVVGGVGAEAGDHRPHEVVLAERAQPWVLIELAADAGHPLPVGLATAAEAARAMGRQDGDRGRQGRQLAQRPELEAGQLVGPVGSQEVGPPGRPGQQAAAGRDGHRRRVVAGIHVTDVPGEVLGRVPGRRARTKPDVTDVEDVAIVDRSMLEGIAPPRGREDLDPVRGAQLERAGQVVVVDVGLDGVGQAPATRRRELGEPPGVARRIDDDRLAVGGGDEVGRVAQAADLERLDVHGVRPS
jgi:hypothetical protein